MVNSFIVASAIYKLSCLGVGLLFGYMGYRLFLARIWGKSGDLRAEFSNSIIVLKEAAPGTFFALFGAFVISFTIFSGFDFQSGLTQNSEKQIPADSTDKGALRNEPPF